MVVAAPDRPAEGRGTMGPEGVEEMTLDRDFWEQRWSQALREHGDKVAKFPPNAHLTEAISDLRPGRALDAGCDAHVAKPVRKTILLQTVNRFAARPPVPAGA